MLLCDWDALYSAVEQLAVRLFPRTPSLLCGSGCGQVRLDFSKASCHPRWVTPMRFAHARPTMIHSLSWWYLLNGLKLKLKPDFKYIQRGYEESRDTTRDSASHETVTGWHHPRNLWRYRIATSPLTTSSSQDHQVLSCPVSISSTWSLAALCPTHVILGGVPLINNWSHDAFYFLEWGWGLSCKESTRNWRRSTPRWAAQGVKAFRHSYLAGTGDHSGGFVSFQ